MASSPQSQDPTSSTLSIQFGNDEILTLEEDDVVVTLNYQPTIMKCKNGERIWQANNDRTCTQMCKSQLKVSSSRCSSFTN